MHTQEIIATHVFLVFPENVIIETGLNIPEYNGLKQFRSLLDIFIWYRGFLHINYRNPPHRYMKTVEYISRKTTSAFEYFNDICERVVVDTNNDPEYMTRKFIPPKYRHGDEVGYTDVLGYYAEKYGMHYTDAMDPKKHVRLEVIRMMKTLDEQRRQFLNWCHMNERQRKISDKYSRYMCDRSNLDHYYDLMTDLYDDFHRNIRDTDDREYSYDSLSFGGSYFRYNVVMVSYVEDNGHNENDGRPLYVRVYDCTSKEYHEIGKIDLKYPAPNSVDDIVDYSSGRASDNNLSTEVKEEIMRYILDRRQDGRDSWNVMRSV
jgi:hypothetical protein